MRLPIFKPDAAIQVPLGAGCLPTEWIDPTPVIAVIRLSREPGTAAMFVFHQNAYILVSMFEIQSSSFSSCTHHIHHGFFFIASTFPVIFATFLP